MTDRRYKGTTYDVEREKEMMLWLEGKLPVLKVLYFEQYEGWHNLIMSEADGILCQEDYETGHNPEKLVSLYAERIRLLQSIDISDCPCGQLDNKKVLEIGCGSSGHSLKWCGDRGDSELWGLDMSTTQIKNAERYLRENGHMAKLFNYPMETD